MVEQLRSPTGKSNIVIGVIIITVLITWVQYIYTDVQNFPCHIDIEKWTLATDGVAQGNFDYAVNHDRLPLYLFTGAHWVKQGMTSLDALQMVSRMSWAICFGVMYMALSTRLGRWPAIFGLLPMAWAHSYSGLTLHINAQMFFNMLVAIHFFVGYRLATSRHWIFWVLLGFVSSLLPVAKEQGFLFPGCALLFLLFQSSPKQEGWMGIPKRLFFFIVGAFPLHHWLWQWLSAMLEYGTKYKELFYDLDQLQGANSFEDMKSSQLHWGTLNKTYHDPDNYLELLTSAWPRLTHENGTHLLVGMGLTLLTLVIVRFQSKRKDLRYLSWILIHILPAIPLFVMLLIEPYHLSFIEIPAVALFSWAFYHLLCNAKGGLSFNALKRVSSVFGGGILLLAMVYCCSVGQPFTMAVPGEIGSCVASRMMNATRYLEQSPNSTVLVTDPLYKFNKTAPANFQLLSDKSELPEQRCDPKAYILTSKWAKYHNNVAPYLHQNEWQFPRRFHSQNNEEWLVYEANCDK